MYYRLIADPSMGEEGEALVSMDTPWHRWYTLGSLRRSIIGDADLCVWVAYDTEDQVLGAASSFTDAINLLSKAFFDKLQKEAA